MKKTLLTLALVASSLTAREFLSKECTYLDNMSQNQILEIPKE